MAFFHLLGLLPFTLFGVSAAYFPLYQAPLQGIYLTSQTVASEQGDAIMNTFAELGGTMVVFDIQTSDGRLAYPSNLPLSLELQNRKDQIPDLAKTVEKIHKKKLTAVARFVLFKNGFIARQKPAWTIKHKGTNRPFASRDGPIWLDPGNPELKEYLTDIGRELALAGVDEVQFDYVRFPESGMRNSWPYSFTGDKTLTRDQVITNFVADIAPELHLLGASVSLDIFGIVVWDDVSWRVIGQNIGELSKHVEALYPMPYPSHFGPGWGGHRNPADEPYFFVQETTKKFLEQTEGSGAKIRPWLQGFSMRVTRFGPQYITDQIRALTDIGIDEFSVWNARNDYSVTFSALKNAPAANAAARTSHR